MKAWIGDRKDAPPFEPPGNIVFVSVDKGTGIPTVDDTPGTITEAFIAGTQPGGVQTVADRRCRLPSRRR